MAGAAITYSTTATKGVRTTHPDYDRMLSVWKKCRDVIAGQRAMHEAGPTYLPKLKDESDNDYSARKARSDFFNGSWITVRAFVGMLFRKPPAKDVPGALDELLKDVTMTGKEAEAFAKALAHEALVITRYGLLVDHPPLPEGVKPITVAAARAMRLRPKLALYTAESIDNWKEQEPGKPGQYAMVKLCEEHPIPEDRFSHKTEKRWRVLDLDEQGFYRQQVWRVNERGEDEQVGNDIYPLMNGRKMTSIPFKTYGADGEEAVIDEPALIDLIEANVAVYQINSDYRHGLHFTGLPTPVISGYVKEGNEDIYIGSTKAWVFPDPNAKASFLEFSGKGLGELRQAIVDKKQEMAMAGARAIMDETNRVETATATQTKRNGENSALANVAITVSSSIEWALGVMAEWTDQAAGEITYQLNRIFLPVMMDAQTLTALIAANQAGKLSDEELFDKMQQGDVIDSEKKFAEHQAQVEIQNPAPARPTPKPGEAAAA
jgi:hypothetical protein